MLVHKIFQLNQKPRTAHLSARKATKDAGARNSTRNRLSQNGYGLWARWSDWCLFSLSCWLFFSLSLLLSLLLLLLSPSGKNPHGSEAERIHNIAKQNGQH